MLPNSGTDVDDIAWRKKPIALETAARSKRSKESPRIDLPKPSRQSERLARLEILTR